MDKTSRLIDWNRGQAELKAMEKKMAKVPGWQRSFAVHEEQHLATAALLSEQLEEINHLRQFIALLKKTANGAFDYWDKDQDSKVGKWLLAMAGRPGIILEIDQGYKAMEPTGGTEEEKTPPGGVQEVHITGTTQITHQSLQGHTPESGFRISTRQTETLKHDRAAVLELALRQAYEQLCYPNSVTMTDEKAMLRAEEAMKTIQQALNITGKTK